MGSPAWGGFMLELTLFPCCLEIINNLNYICIIISWWGPKWQSWSWIEIVSRLNLNPELTELKFKRFCITLSGKEEGVFPGQQRWLGNLVKLRNREKKLDVYTPASLMFLADHVQTLEDRDSTVCICVSSWAFSQGSRIKAVWRSCLPSCTTPHRKRDRFWEIEVFLSYRILRIEGQ